MNEITDPFADDTPAPLGGGEFFISDSALEKLASFEEITRGEFFRIQVHGGGCSGLRYEFGFDTAVNDDDIAFNHDNIKVVIDQESLRFLNQSQLDYKKQMIGAYFTINNPQAKSQCGCGMSFAV